MRQNESFRPKGCAQKILQTFLPNFGKAVTKVVKNFVVFAWRGWKVSKVK